MRVVKDRFREISSLDTLVALVLQLVGRQIEVALAPVLLRTASGRGFFAAGILLIIFILFCCHQLISSHMIDNFSIPITRAESDISFCLITVFVTQFSRSQSSFKI